MNPLSSQEPAPLVRVCYLRDALSLYEPPTGGGEALGLAYATPGSVGLDLRACFEAGEDEVIIPPGERRRIPVGVAVEPVTPGYAGFVYSRSGLGAVHGLTVAQGVGVIDPDFRGEISVFLLNTSTETRRVGRGERIAQLVFQPAPRVRLETNCTLDATERGKGGFGHTGTV